MFENVYACLVHESQECVVDLVRNLRCCDPESPILLYDGSGTGLLTEHFPYDRYGAVIHPASKPMHWGRLHDFALDSMKFCLETFKCDSMTIVDSDQLLIRPGYSAFLDRAASQNRGAGMFVSDTSRHGPNTSNGPCKSAFGEINLWRPFLKLFPSGEEQFAYWTFWPGTVFLNSAIRDLVDRFNRDELLREILETSKLWATEEVIFPTLTRLLGYNLAQNPCRAEYVQYRAEYDTEHVRDALTYSDQFWIHPVPRSYGDPVRTEIRDAVEQFGWVHGKIRF